jgi:hypothetical protein
MSDIYSIIEVNGVQAGADGKITVPMTPDTIPDFIQVTPSSIWIVNHNTGIKRSLEFFSEDGVRMNGDIRIVSNNQTRGEFLIPVSGFAKVI